MSALDFLGYAIISSKLVSDKHNINYREKVWIVTSNIIIFSILMGLSGGSIIGKYNFIVGNLISIIFIYILYRESFKETIYIYVITTIILLLAQFILLALLSTFIGDEVFSFTNGLIAQGTMLLVLFLIFRYIPLNILLNYIGEGNKIFKILIANIFIILISFLIYRYIEMSGVLKDILIISISSVGFIFINFVLIDNGLKNKYEEDKLKIYEKYLPIIDELMGEIRAKQHEFDNHIQALNMIAITGVDHETIMESVKKYIEDIESFADTSNLIKLDNKILAGFLYSKVKKSKEMNINFQIDIKDFGFRTNLKDYELIEVIGNLIDNGFETGVNNNAVFLKLKKEEDMNVIEVKNKHSYLKNNTIIQLFNIGYSTKLKDGRGYGLPNMKKIVDKHGGRIVIANESIGDENYVVFKILLIRI